MWHCISSKSWKTSQILKQELWNEWKNEFKLHHITRSAVNWVPGTPSSLTYQHSLTRTNDTWRTMPPAVAQLSHSFYRLRNDTPATASCWDILHLYATQVRFCSRLSLTAISSRISNESLSQGKVKCSTNLLRYLPFSRWSRSVRTEAPSHLRLEHCAWHTREMSDERVSSIGPPLTAHLLSPNR